jgi:hypothetical protein|tara:strand:+ start:5208 stop:5444 length:237 start_codon:yes stop_codon:yes gene_type:complete
MNEGMNSLHFGELRRVSIQEIIERRRIRRSRSRERERERERNEKYLMTETPGKTGKKNKKRKERNFSTTSTTTYRRLP